MKMAEESEPKKEDSRKEDKESETAAEKDEKADVEEIYTLESILFIVFFFNIEKNDLILIITPLNDINQSIHVCVLAVVLALISELSTLQV